MENEYIDAQPQSSGITLSANKNTDGTLSPEKYARLSSTLRWLLLLLPFAYLWFRLINNVRLEWGSNPQYSYGWLVPIMCIGLLLRRWIAMSEGDQKTFPLVNPRFRWVVFAIFCLIALLYLPTRLVEGATPEWRPIQWMLAMIAIGLTLTAIYLGTGKTWLSQVAFPVAFILVAIPWPSLIEEPIIQGLTRWNAATVIEVMGALGVPAMQHGNVIEIGSGVVGIDEACSGIRSFQSSFMLSLFYGEYYRLVWPYRLLLIPASIIMSFAFNVLRTSLLTWIAANKGVEAISQYHDPAGVAILIACTGGIWALSWWLSNKGKAPESSEAVQNQMASSKPKSPLFPASMPRRLVLKRLAIGLALWLVTVEIGVEAWYRNVETHFIPGPNWSFLFPENNPTFKAFALTDKERYLLRYDEGKEGEWQESDGSVWHAFYFTWLPGRISGYLAKRHTPDICMTATGKAMTAGPELMLLNIKGITLPVRHYVFGDSLNEIQVFHCRWEDGMSKDALVQNESARFNLVRGIWAGRGIHGQKVFEFVVSGAENAEQAKAGLVRQLENQIQIEGGDVLKNQGTTKITKLEPPVLNVH